MMSNTRQQREYLVSANTTACWQEPASASVSRVVHCLRNGLLGCLQASSDERGRRRRHRSCSAASVSSAGSVRSCHSRRSTASTASLNVRSLVGRRELNRNVLAKLATHSCHAYLLQRPHQMHKCSC